MPSLRPSARPTLSGPAQPPWWQRAARALGDRLRPPARLQPQPVGVWVGGPHRRAAAPADFTVRVFGRRRDEPAPDEDAEADPDAAAGGDPGAEPHDLDLPAWAPRAIQPDPPDAVGERTVDSQDSTPSWLAASGVGAHGPTSGATEPAEAPTPAWAVMPTPAWSVGARDDAAEVAAADDAEISQTPTSADAPSWEPDAVAEEADGPAAEAEEAGGPAAEADEASDPDPVPAAAGPEGGWDMPAVPPPAVPAPEDGSRSSLVRPRPLAEPRPFPLPDGEMIFRNLRTAFTDPARLLRHLGDEGHTGVMEVLGAGGRESYVVLLDGAVVGVAVESGGALHTRDRLTFPAFPDGEDTLNVVRYPPEIARALGLLLHAPVYFSGLGAAFVNLDGLSQYLERQRADGGLLVMSGQEVGVALFTAGRLVGAYTSSEPTLGDLERIRPLVADAAAEIDVRIGGPAEALPLSMDQLLGPGA